MTRREFLKNIGKILTGLSALYVGRLSGIFQKTHLTSTLPKRPAKFYRQADDLAG